MQAERECNESHENGKHLPYFGLVVSPRYNIVEMLARKVRAASVQGWPVSDLVGSLYEAIRGQYVQSFAHRAFDLFT